MPTIVDLTALVEHFAAATSHLNLTGDEQEEYSTMLSRLQDQVESGEPSDVIVRECLSYLEHATSRAA